MRTPVLATKLRAPIRSSRLVARPRLVDRLDATLDADNRLVLVSAPAGFGKTTLLGDWIAGLESRPVAVRLGWLSLDEDDNDLSRFLTHLTAALGDAGIDVGRAGLSPEAAAAPRSLLTAIVNEAVRATDDEAVPHRLLVLDDYHAIAAPDVHEAMTFLVDHLPDRLQLVVATRSDPPFPLARLRSRNQLTELRARDLRFTAAEALEFLTRVGGLDLSTADSRALAERTEGWVAGLQLAALSLREIGGAVDRTRFITAFAGSNRFVIDYLADEVLARQPDEVRDFLLRTAVLDQLTGDLCDAVTGGDRGAGTLAELERRNLFVVPLDDQRSWYRYHHLFADVLGARLLAERPDEVPGLHRRASAWYAAHQLPVPAVRHALAAEDFDHAARLMEGALPGLRRARQDTLLLTWVRSLPESVVRRSPALSIVAAWSMMMAGDLDAMEHRLDDAAAALAAGDEDPQLARAWADTEDLRTAPATIAVYRASLAQARGDVAGTERHARRALDLAGPTDHFVHGAAGGYLGLAAWAAGDVAVALTTFGAAVGHLHAAGNLVDELDATVVLADMWVAAGRPGRARRLYEENLKRAIAGGEPYPRATADIHVGLAQLDRERDDLLDAEAHLETAHALGQVASIAENRYRWYVAMAEVRAATGDHGEAARLLDEAEGLYRHGFYPDVRPIAARRARLAIVVGDLAAAAGWAEDRGDSADDTTHYLHEYDHLTLVRLLLAEGRAGQPGDGSRLASALDLLDTLHTAATTAARAGSLVEIRLLQALAHHAADDADGALAALGHALRDGPEPDGYVRLYLDEGAAMSSLLHLAVTRWGDATPGHARRLLGRAAGRTDEPQQPLADPLSRRELEVLRLLDGELTGPEIARELYVSLNTLRSHTKRIFTKLDVNHRAAAVRRARQLGLL